MVSGSTRSAMNSRKGRIAASSAGPTSIWPLVIGSIPVTQAWVKTGSMTYQVRNIARLMISMFGGACCKPMA